MTESKDIVSMQPAYHAMVKAMIVGGASDEEIVEYANKSMVGAPQSPTQNVLYPVRDQVPHFINEARESMGSNAEINPYTEIGKSILRLNSIYKKATAGNDLTVALSAQRELNKLLKLYTFETEDNYLVKIDDVRARWAIVLGSIEESLNQMCGTIAKSVLRLKKEASVKKRLEKGVKKALNDALSKGKENA